MDDIILWLDTLDPGTEILTPDDWALGKRADGTWEFVFAPCMTVTAGQVAAHGRPEIIPRTSGTSGANAPSWTG